MQPLLLRTTALGEETRTEITFEVIVTENVPRTPS